MKYTVVIRQPVLEAVLPQLQNELQKSFGLSADQAAKLAARRSGRLMKPNSRPRAERLAELFSSVGAQVSVEEVRDDTTFLADPFLAQRPGPVRPGEGFPVTGPTESSLIGSGVMGGGTASGERSGPAFGAPLGGGSVAVAAPPAAAPLPASPPSASPWDALDSYAVSPPGWASAPAPAAAPALGGRYLEHGHPEGHPTASPTTDGSFLPSDPLPTAAPFVQRDADLIVPTVLPTHVPDMNLWSASRSSQPAGAPHSNQSVGSQSVGGQPMNVQPMNGLSGAHTAVLADPLLPGGSSAHASSPDLVVTPAPLPVPPVPVQASADDAWADFTGSLSSAAPVSEAPAAPAEPGVLRLETPAEERPMTLGRRSSLARRVLTSALVPLTLFTAVTLAFLAYLLPSAQSRLIGENAQAVAVAVGGSLDTSNQDTVNAQLDALIRRTSVGFVLVELPDGTSFFRSKDAATGGTLSEQVADWVKTHPQTSNFTQSGSPADAFRSQLKDLEDVGAGQSAQAAALRQSVANPENQKSSTAHYVLSRVGVAENAQGQRTVQTDVGAAPRGLLYSIVVGVPSDTALSELRTTLLLVFGVALLAFVVAALLAARTARQVVQPIERLVRAADAISLGDLAQPVTPEKNDEIGDLAQALERMRLSLDTAMERLRRRRTAK